YTNGEADVKLIVVLFTILLCSKVAASAILVQWTWGRKWGVIRIAFTLSRYVPFAGALMTSYSAVKTWGTQNCAPFNDAVNGIHFLGIIASEGLLIARVYAFSGNSKVYLISLLSFGLAILVASLIISIAPINLNIPGVAGKVSRRQSIQYSFSDNLPLVLISVTAFLRYRHYLESHSTLIKSIYRDGLFYMFCITSIDTIFIIYFLSYSETLNTPQIVAHSVLASRILFNLQVSRETPSFPTERSSSMEMLSRPHELQAWSEGSETVAGPVQPDWQP
ncbi:hypothetical protein DEU56DRAFT_821377, partial [Suillus clintonianus]|uniref:uncharacterized protein n=1 Tax=Suillus clintonianus TaxID=1904413 RepID=UPI001B863CB3